MWPDCEITILGLTFDSEIRHRLSLSCEGSLALKIGRKMCIKDGIAPTATPPALPNVLEQVRIVYMMVTASDEDVLKRLGCGTQYKMPFNNDQNVMESYVEGVRLLGETSRDVAPRACEITVLLICMFFGPSTGFKTV